MSVFIYTTELENYQVQSFKLDSMDSRSFKNESDGGKRTQVEIWNKRTYKLSLQNLSPAQTESILNYIEVNMYLPLDIENERIAPGYLAFLGVTDTTINFWVDKDKMKISRDKFILSYNLDLFLEDKKVL